MTAPWSWTSLYMHLLPCSFMTEWSTISEFAQSRYLLRTSTCVSVCFENDCWHFALRNETSSDFFGKHPATLCSSRKSDLSLQFTRIQESSWADVFIEAYLSKCVQNDGQLFSYHPKTTFSSTFLLWNGANIKADWIWVGESVADRHWLKAKNNTALSSILSDLLSQNSDAH